jgi:hypothetical protein
MSYLRDLGNALAARPTSAISLKRSNIGPGRVHGYAKPRRSGLQPKTRRDAFKRRCAALVM